MDEPSVTWPSPAITALSLCRTARMVVAWNIRRGYLLPESSVKKLLPESSVKKRGPHVRGSGRQKAADPEQK